MSVTIIDKPKSFDFRGNGLKYKVNGDNYIISETCKAHFIFKKVAALVAGDRFYFPVPGSVSKTIVCYASPDTDSPNKLTVGATIEVTLSELESFYDINKYYKLWIENTSELHCEFLYPASCFTHNIAFVTAAYEDIHDDNNLLIQACDARIVEPNYHINAVINFQDKNIATIKADVDSEGNAELEFGKYLPKNTFEIGDIAHDIYKNTKDLTFKVGFSEHYGPGNWPLTFSPEIKVMTGKLSFEEHKNWQNYPRFLNIFKKQNTHVNAFLKLCFSFGGEMNRLTKFFVKYYYTDKTNESIIIFETNANFDDLYFLNMKTEQLLNQSNQTKEVYRFDIYIDVEYPVSAKFYLRKQNYLDKEFGFKNKYGVYETFIATGNKVVEKVIDRKLYKRYTPANYETIDGEFTSIVNSSHNEYSVFSGNMSLDEIQQIADAIRTEMFYERDGSKWIKCELLTDSVQISDEADFLHSLTFKYRYSSDD